MSPELGGNGDPMVLVVIAAVCWALYGLQRLKESRWTR